MTCYQCGEAEGSETVLCPKCRTERAKSQITVADTINQSEGRFLPYIKLLKDEWHIAVGLAFMIIAVAKAVDWFLLTPQQAFDPSGVFGPDAAKLYESCMVELESVDPSSLDVDALTKAYEHQLKELTSAGTDTSDPIQVLIKLRASEACAAAKDTCDHYPSSEACNAFVAAYAP